MKALLLCNYDVYGAAMVTEHINAIIDHSLMDIYVYNDLVKNRGALDFVFDINDFDVIIVHYSIFLAVDVYCSTRTKALLKAARALKVAFLQDEYRFVDRSIEAMHEAGVGLVFSCVPTPSIPKVYPPEKMKNIRVVNTLTGYASSYLATIKPIELNKRRYDVSYRGRKYPDWHGRMGREKYEIAEKFQRQARGTALRLNISCEEKDRVYGLEWVELIRNSRAVLGVESGASVFDFTGEVSSRTETMRDLFGEKGITYEELRQACFGDSEDLIDLAQISPRVLEAICLRTACVLFEGSYSGMLSPNDHYIPLKKDFSNFDEVARRITDDKFVSEIIANAYVQVAVRPEYSYKSFVAQMDEEIRKENIAAQKHSGVIVDAMVKEFDASEDARKFFKIERPLQKEMRSEYCIDMAREQLSHQQFRQLYDETYQFKVFHYPHGISHKATASVSILRKFVKFAKRNLPHGLRTRLKSLLR